MKEAAYKGMVSPVLEYGSFLWDPNTKALQDELEMYKHRAARFVTRNCETEYDWYPWTIEIGIP